MQYTTVWLHLLLSSGLSEESEITRLTTASALSNMNGSELIYANFALDSCQTFNE